MVSLMQRRREMIGAAEPIDPNLVYSISNRVVTAGEIINTKTYPLGADYSMTILFDMDVTSMPTSGTSSKTKFIRIWNQALNKEGLNFGKGSAGATGLTSVWMGQSYGLSNSEAVAGRHRIAITHAANSNSLTVKWKLDNKTVRSHTPSRTFTAAPGNYFYFGSNATDAGLPAGTINSAKLYNRILTTAEINAFFA